MPFVKSKRYSSNAALTGKETFNPFPDVYSPHHYAEPPRSPTKLKKGRKCMQLVLICQKLLRPFGSHKSSNEKPKVGQRLEKSRSAFQISTKSCQQTDTAVKLLPDYRKVKIDASVQTNIDSSYYTEMHHKQFQYSTKNHDIYDLNSRVDDNNNNINEDSNSNGNSTTNRQQFKSLDFREAPESYWDLDIDSAIVGDFSSISETSLNDNIDPLYSTIKWTEEGGFVYKPSYPPNYPNNQMFYESPEHQKVSHNYSNTSSPKSGVYSKIQKNPTVTQPKFQFIYPEYKKYDMDSKLNFDHIMRIRSQLGLSTAPTKAGAVPFETTSSTCLTESSTNITPEVPNRNYGESVISLIKKYRQNFRLHSDSINDVTSPTSSLSHNELYSPIWLARNKKICSKLKSTDVNNNYSNNNCTDAKVIESDKKSSAPASEPITAKYSVGMVTTTTIPNNLLHQINPMFNDGNESIESSSCISIYSPIRKPNRINYPLNFYENTNCVAMPAKYSANQINDLDIKSIRHMDSEVDLKSSKSHLYDYLCDTTNVPLKKSCFIEDSHLLTLKPLMERSCEDDFFKRDIKLSLDFINF